MKGWRAIALYGVLFLLAALASLKSSNAGNRDDVPSVANSDPRGIRALFLYLSETGKDVRRLDTSLEHLPPDLETVVLAGVEAREVTATERQALEAFVKRGHTLVYLTGHNRDRIPSELAEWLRLRVTAWRPPSRLSAKRNLTVWHPVGPFAGMEHLQTSAARGIWVDLERAIPVAGDDLDTFVWYLPQEKGSVYAMAGTDFADNVSIAGADNIVFWDALAQRGPIAFDEWHHVVPTLPPASRALAASILQILVLVLIVFWARGVRLGPPRPELVERNRSTVEYLDSFAWLLRRARVEAELVRALKARVRRRLWETAQIPSTLSDADAALEWATRSDLPPDRFIQWAQRAELAQSRGATPGEFTRLSAEASVIERSV